jgi:hypothetical protein
METRGVAARVGLLIAAFAGCDAKESAFSNRAASAQMERRQITLPAYHREHVDERIGGKNPEFSSYSLEVTMGWLAQLVLAHEKAAPERGREDKFEMQTKLSSVEGKLDFPTNGGHPVKGVNSPREVQLGQVTTPLHC